MRMEAERGECDVMGFGFVLEWGWMDDHGTRRKG